MDNKSKVKLVNDVDSWAQENNRGVDRQLGFIYRRAANTDNGWESVLDSSPEVFNEAYIIALQYTDKVN